MGRVRACRAFLVCNPSRIRDAKSSAAEAALRRQGLPHAGAAAGPRRQRQGAAALIRSPFTMRCNLGVAGLGESPRDSRNPKLDLIEPLFVVALGFLLSDAPKTHPVLVRAEQQAVQWSCWRTNTVRRTRPTPEGDLVAGTKCQGVYNKAIGVAPYRKGVVYSGR